MLVIKRWVVAQFLIFCRVLAQRPQPAAHGISRSIVAADDQQREIAKELGRVIDQVFCRLAVRQHGDQVEARRSSRPFMPQGGERAKRLG